MHWVPAVGEVDVGNDVANIDIATTSLDGRHQLYQTWRAEFDGLDRTSPFFKLRFEDPLRQIGSLSVRQDGRGISVANPTSPPPLPPLREKVYPKK